MKRDFIDYLFLLPQVFIAAFACYIGYQQYKTAKNKLRLDLYQRRFTVYQSALEFYYAMIGPREFIQSDAFGIVQNNFIKSYRESQFLFGKDSGVFLILGEMHSKSFIIINCKENNDKGVIIPSEIMNKYGDFDDALKYFNSKILVLENKIDPYLNFRKIQ